MSAFTLVSKRARSWRSGRPGRMRTSRLFASRGHGPLQAAQAKAAKKVRRRRGARCVNCRRRIDRHSEAEARHCCDQVLSTSTEATGRDAMSYVGRTPKRAPTGRIVVHNHVRPAGFPNVAVGQAGFRVWTDVPTPKGYRVVACRCGWAPHLRRHFRVKKEITR